MTERRVRLWLGALGFYYAVTGLWAAIAFEHFRGAVHLPINAFQAWAFAAVIVPVGLAFLVAAWRGVAVRFAAGLGAAIAISLAVTELLWLPRFATAGALWLDFPIELFFAGVLGWAAWRGWSFDGSGQDR